MEHTGGLWNGHTGVTARSGVRRMSVAVAVWLLLSAGVTADIEINKSGDRYDLIARGAPLADILQRIDALEEATMRFSGNLDRPVTAVYRDIALDELLYRLRVTYMLVYERDAADSISLPMTTTGKRRIHCRPTWSRFPTPSERGRRPSRLHGVSHYPWTIYSRSTPI